MRRYIKTVSVNNLPRLCASNVDKSNKENGFTLNKARSRQYSVETKTDADYADDIALLANTPTQAESQLHSLGQTGGDIGFHVNVNKAEYMYFNQKGAISTLNGDPLKLVDKFTYFGSSVSSIENYINMRLEKAWTTMNMEVWSIR